MVPAINILEDTHQKFYCTSQRPLLPSIVSYILHLILAQHLQILHSILADVGSAVAAAVSHKPTGVRISPGTGPNDTS